MQNTILDNISEDFDGKTADVYFTINNDITASKIIILIEGADDKVFYEKYLNSDSAYLLVMDGHKWMAKVLNDLRYIFPGRLLAIKDADFDNLDGRVPECDNMFLTDGHDWEMTMVSEGLTMKTALHYNVNDNTGASMHSEIIDSIIDYSYVRWANQSFERIENRLEFKANTQDFCHKHINDCVDKLNSDQKEATRHLEPEYVENFKKNHPDVDWKQLVNGHDYFRLLHNQIHKSKGVKEQLKKGEVKASYLSLYRADDFNSTQLAQSLYDAYPRLRP